MGNNEMSIINYSGLKNRPIAVSLTSACVIVGLAWASVAKPWLVRELAADFATKAEFVIVDQKLDKLIRKDVRESAYSTIRNIEGDIKRHKVLENGSREWTETMERFDKRLETAILHRDCVIHGDPNCEDIAAEIW